MKKFMVKSRGGNIDIPVYVSELTNLMQMRILKKDREWDCFECGVDYHHGLWLTNVGTWGANLQELVENYFRYVYKGYMTQIEYVRICDDGEVLKTERVESPVAFACTEVIDVENLGD